MASANGTCAITGASGYVGSILTKELKKHMPVVAMVRKPGSDDIGWSFESRTDVAEALRAHGVKTLVHAAWDMHATTIQELDRICVKGSAALFEAAARGGVERIVFISTISAFEGCRSAYGKTKLSVERLVKGRSGIIFRPGLVFGGGAGGAFGAMKRQVAKGRWVPMIGNGNTPQYLLHEGTLAESMVSAVSGAFDGVGAVPITLAHPKAWPLRELLASIAAGEGRKVRLIPVPWQLVFAGIRMGELLNVSLPFRSDSVLSFIYSDKNPDFGTMNALGIKPIPYERCS